jgi:asparagine synthase (glutamine-hydrolysing)
MCGISGIINKDNSKVANEEIRTINDLIAHRGPDSEGYYFGDNFAFGHRRLAILDLSPQGHQPMDFAGKYTITYNGEVYNYLEIRKELESAGYSFTSTTDTEVILAAYDHWGTECPVHFNGMWAFAIYDKTKNLLFCSRDRFGIKPFYFTETDNKFIFGSEIKQLLHFHDSNILNTGILLDYLIADLEEHTNETFFKGVFKLPQSHNLIYDLGSHSYEIQRYFTLKSDDNLNKLAEEETVGRLRSNLENAIGLRLRSDVKVGTCLSGGLDSSSIAAIASKAYYAEKNEKFVAIHAKSVEAKTDESHFAEQVANHCNLDLHTVTPRLNDITGNIREIVYTQEEPFGSLSIFMQYFVMQEARKAGCKVMLDGQGGDESLFGYEFYYSVYLAAMLKNFRFGEFFREFKKLKNFRFTKMQIIMRILIALSFGIRSLKYTADSKKLGLKVKYNARRLKPLFAVKSPKDFQMLEILHRKLPNLLKYEDKNAMRHAVETRLPFVDYHFVTTAVSFDDKLKFKDGYLKYTLRRVVENILPAEVVWRTNKFGFEAPSDLWIAENKDMMIENIKASAIIQKLMNPSGKALNDNKLLWKLYNIAIWEQVYQVKI